MHLPHPVTGLLRGIRKHEARLYSSLVTPPTSPFAPRHFLSIADLSSQELIALVRNAAVIKQAYMSGAPPKHLVGSMAGETVAMMFSKRSTRTRVSTVSAVVKMGGHPMFLGKEDIQLGVRIYMHR